MYCHVVANVFLDVQIFVLVTIYINDDFRPSLCLKFTDTKSFQLTSIKQYVLTSTNRAYPENANPKPSAPRTLKFHTVIGLHKLRNSENLNSIS